MPTNPSDTMGGDVQYPDDLEGRTFYLDNEMMHGRVQFWHSEDEFDKEVLPDGAKFGWWLPVLTESGEETWIACPLDLREQLRDWDAEGLIEPGDPFEVTKVVLGSGPTDPHRVTLSLVEE